MRVCGWSIILAAWALASCGSDAPAPQPAQSETASADALPVMGPERRILAFGDSLFAGYGLPESESYPSRLEAALRARGVNARIANAGVSGDTSAAALGRFNFTLDNQAEPPELVLVELGGNDMLRGLSPAETRRNIAAILKELKHRKMRALLVGMKAPPNLGASFEHSFDAIYPDLAKQYGVPLVPFFLEPIYNRPELLQDDNIHPTAQGVEQLVAATVDEVEEALPDKK